MFFVREGSKFIPILPWDRRGALRQSDGREIVTLDDAIKLLAADLRVQWESIWRDLLTTNEADAICGGSR